MGRVKFRPDKPGIGAFLRGPEVRAMVRESGDRIAERAGRQFEADTWISPEPGRSGQPRAVSGVKATVPTSKNAERLRAAIEAGRVQ